MRWLCCHWLHLFRREGARSPRPDGGITDSLLTEHGFALWLALGLSCRAGHVERAAQGQEQGEEDGADPGGYGCFAGYRGRDIRSYISGRAGRGRMRKAGQVEEGLEAIAEALAIVEKNEERWNEAELYRIKGRTPADAGKLKATELKQALRG